MKSPKQTILIMLFGLLLFAFAAAMAQDPPAQGDQKKVESCCSMESCCCNDGSCPMKKEGKTTSADAEAKHDDCCSGDSCDMSKHDAMMKHDANMKHDMKGHKDCCKMKQKDKAKDKKAA
jgi:hypothetical protein